MTREEAQEFLPILQAYADGKTIQYRAIEDGYWYDVIESDDLDPMAFKYRIRPEVKYRPFKDADECWNEMEKHKPFGWVYAIEDGSRQVITGLMDYDENHDENVLFDIESGCLFIEAVDKYNFIDTGTPFGIMEGGEV